MWKVSLRSECCLNDVVESAAHNPEFYLVWEYAELLCGLNKEKNWKLGGNFGICQIPYDMLFW